MSEGREVQSFPTTYMARTPRLPGVPPPKHRFEPAIIADRIRRAREAAGMSRKEMAANADIPRWAYYKKEKGDAPFYLDEIERVCDALPGCGSLFPFLDWDAAILADRMLNRSNPRGK